MLRLLLMLSGTPDAKSWCGTVIVFRACDRCKRVYTDTSLCNNVPYSSLSVIEDRIGSVFRLLQGVNERACHNINGFSTPP